MNYPYPEHNVGTTVYRYDAETDSVTRCQVVGIEAHCAQVGQWEVTYTVVSSHAVTPGRWSAAGKDLKRQPDYAFPEPQLECEAPQKVVFGSDIKDAIAA